MDERVMETPQRNYQSVSDMVQGEATVSWKNFCVHLAGKTEDAHQPIVAMIKAMGQTEVPSDEESDYLLVFCPVVSRVGTDVGRALRNIPCNKPVILVVMHHTPHRNHVVAESRRLVNNPNVHLTVDLLFHQGKLLKCDLNNLALTDVVKFFAVPDSQKKSNNCFKKYWKLIIFISSMLVLMVIMSIISVESMRG